MQSAALRVSSLAAAPVTGRQFAAGPHLRPAPAFTSQRRQRGAAVPTTAIATPWSKPAPAFQPPAPWQPSQASPAHPALRGVGVLWQAYLLSLARRPLLTKAATTFFCVCIGDLIAQTFGGMPLSAVRMLRLACYNATVGATVGHYWHRWLEAHVDPRNPAGNRAVLTKMALDQLLLTPVMTAVFFAALKLMEGRPDAILPFMQDKYVSTLLAGYAIWVPWNYASFKWIPQDLRILAGNLVGIGWGTFVSMSCINSQGGSAVGDASASSAAMMAVDTLPSSCPAVLAAVEGAAIGAQ